MSLQSEEGRGKKRNKRGEKRWFEGERHKERARSYKGVVINGNAALQHKGKETREYYGKGKGKMVDEADYKWVKQSDQEGKRSRAYHGGMRRNDEESGRKTATEEGASRKAQGERRRLSPQDGTREEVREEGEFQDTKIPPSLKFQEELLQTQASPEQPGLAIMGQTAEEIASDSSLIILAPEEEKTFKMRMVQGS